VYVGGCAYEHGASTSVLAISAFECVSYSSYGAEKVPVLEMSLGTVGRANSADAFAALEPLRKLLAVSLSPCPLEAAQPCGASCFGGDTHCKGALGDDTIGCACAATNGLEPNWSAEETV